MMDKKSANGFQSKASEGGVQRKQLPYSVETPYGFHLDLDFLKYVDDIEKGNTIKRVHIQRRVKGPPKFSTLPRNFSLPGHGARPVPKEKDTPWSGTSTLGPKPKSRVTEVQQIYDFRTSEGGTSSQSSRGATSPGSAYVSAKPRDELGTGARDAEVVGIQSRPNLLRASSMPITLQQRKGSDSSSPDRTVGTPESGSTENMFRPSPDITERRCVPQDRTGLHQQITVALKRVRELEEQVKTIPELKAQIYSLREEREKLLLQLQAQAQAQAQAQVSTSSSTIIQSSDSGTHTQPQGHRPSEGLNLALMTHPTEGLEASECMPAKLVEDHTIAKRPPKEPNEKQSQSQTVTQGPSPSSSEVQTRPKSIQSHTTATRRNSKEQKALQKGSSVSQPPRRGSGEAQARTTRQGSCDTQTPSQGSRRSSSEIQSPHKDDSETQSLRRGSSETGQRRGSSEASRRDAGDAQPPRRGSSESPTSPAALGQVVTRLTGLLGEQWAQLGGSSGAQQTTSQQETPSTQKQTAVKRAEAGKGAAAKPAGKAVPAATTGKPAGKPGPSKMSSIQSQLVSSLSVLSAFYSPSQKAAAASKQQEQGLKSIMKKNGVADKQGNKGAKKNLKFVGVNGGYETTSSEESSGDEKPKVELEEEDSSEPEVEKEKETEPQPEEKPEEGEETKQKDAEVSDEAGAAVAAEKESERGLLDPEGSQDLLEEQAEGENVDQRFIDACLYVKDRMEEVSSPDKEMRQVLVLLYQEWFRISSQKDSQADTVRLYLRQVGLTTPTLLPYVVNLTDGNGNMALHYSVSHSNFPVVKLLLDTGLCETDNVNKAGYTPVMLAALTAADSPDDLEVAQQLLKLGDVNACSRQASQTALMLAVSHGRVAMVKLLLSCGADVNSQDREGSTALMCASEHGHTHIVRLLLETGRCDLSLTDKNGHTAQLVAEGASHQDIIDLLKAHAETRASEPSSTTDLL
ncbi:KN motif and ankyrin repeat domain-containing protein 4 [Collichthys lucidus]|uniref:KN motif and ankyrin repeat domain-containing protein 4 n=1 Tax=Collichthys lucidus TaxID=240159 RepID=A0A4U5UJ85_COLLU|nr:KN motif and ankyrin repeat domain-containing protein 4 [Collichthys lucidus]